MDDKRNPEVVQRLTQWIENYNSQQEDNKGGQEEAAKRTGYTSGAISQYLGNKYSADPKNIEKKILAFLQTDDEAKGVYEPPEYVDTSISSAVYKTLRYIHLTSKFTIECGDAGIGKTKAAEKYVKDYPSNSILITMNPCFAETKKPFLKTLCRALEISSSAGCDDMWIACLNKLSRKTLLIIDEAQEMSRETINVIRHMWDAGKWSFGVVLIGNHLIVDKIRDDKSKKYDQLNNRIGKFPERFTKDIITEDIVKLFPAIKDDKKAVRFLLEVARSREGVRGAVNIFSFAHDNGNITYDGIIAAAKMRQLELRYH